MTSKNILRALLILFIAGLSGPAAQAGEAPAPPIVFLNIADLHVTADDTMDEFKQVIALANRVIRPAFTYIAGDTPDGGTLQEYQAFKAAMDTLKGPVYNVAGDHEAKGGGMEHYRAVLGQPTYSFDMGSYHIIALNSMDLGEPQLTWARQDLAAAQQQGRTNLMLIHHDLAGLKDKAMQAEVQKLVRDHKVKLVLSGHTHANTVINDGASLQITTTSLKAPRGQDPASYALVTLDQGHIAWHAVPLGQELIVAITSPLSKLMTTGPEGLVRGKTTLRAKVFSPASIKSVLARIGNGPTIALENDGQVWSAAWDSTVVPDGQHLLSVEAVDAEGRSGQEQIAILVNQAGAYTPSPVTVSDAKGGKGPKEGKGKPVKEAVALEQIPAAARAALKKEAGPADFQKLEKETKDGRELYVGEWKGNPEGKAKVTADGQVIEREELLSAAAVPPAIRQAAEDALKGMGNGQFKRKTTLRQGAAAVEYDVRADIDGRKEHLRIDSTGTVKPGPGGKGKGPKPEKAKGAKP